MKLVYLGDSCAVGGDPAMNIIIALVPVLNVPENIPQLLTTVFASSIRMHVNCKHTANDYKTAICLTRSGSGGHGPILVGF